MSKQTLLCAFKNAFSGLKEASKERNFRIDICFAVLAIVLGFLLRINLVEWCIIGLCIMIVLSLETLNTSVEHAVDLSTNEIKEDARIAKDAAAGAVLISAIGSVIIAFIIFIPKLLLLMGY